MSEFETSSLKRSLPPKSFSVIRANWLSRRLNPNAVFVAALASLFIALVSLARWDDLLGVAKYLDATGNLVFKDGEYWRAWTSALVHSDLKHLLSNLFMFFIFGWFLYGYFGFVLFPLSAFVFGGVINLLILPTYAPAIKLVGASGIVFYLGGLWLGLYFLIQRQQTLFQRSLRVGGVGLALFMPSEAFNPAISYRTHFLAMGVGIVVAIIYFAINKSRFLRSEVREWIVEEPEDFSDPTTDQNTSSPFD